MVSSPPDLASVVRPDHHNGFDVLRIGAAAAVIFSHHFHITGTKPPAWLHSDMVGGVAVMTFFTISGFLVTLSWLRDPRAGAFVFKRLLRLWPGMLVAVVSGVFLFGTVFTSLPVNEFLLHPETLAHWRNLLLIKAYVTLPGVFSSNPLAGLMNGPLWTIPLELMCYAVLAVAGMLGILRWRALACVVLVGYLVFFLTLRNADLSGSMRHWFEYPAYFASGSLIAFGYKNFLAHGAKLVLILLPMAAALFWGLKLEHTAGLLLLPSLLIYLGSLRAPLFSWLHRAGDPSYGVYMLGCPVQQAVQAVFPQLPFASSLAIALALALAAGYASWHLVEKPALRLKRLVGQG